MTDYERLTKVHKTPDEEALLSADESMEGIDLPPLTEEEERELLSEEPSIQDNIDNFDVQRIYSGPGRDGVFSNMSAKPNQGKAFEEIEPPSYHDVIVDPSPDYGITCVDESGETLIEGFPVGDYLIFIVNSFISLTFDILGFFLTTIMATTHAARFGSQNGFGLTLMRYGYVLKLKLDEIDFTAIQYENGYRPDPDEERSRRLWTAIFISFIGAFLVIRANLEFYRLRRMRELVGSSAPIVF